MISCRNIYFLTVCILSVLNAGAQVIDFESPDYAVGAGLPSPWIIGGGETAGITDSGAISGSQSLYAALPNNGEYSCRYPVTAPGEDTFSFSITIKTGSYNPGYSDPGIFSLGGVTTTDWYLGGVYFEMRKPIYAELQPSHRQIWFKEVSNIVGYFVNGGVYTITYDINWASHTSVVRIVGDGGIDLTFNNQDASIDKNNFTGINLRGSQSWAPWVPSPALFDNFIIPDSQQPIAGDFDNNGIVNLYDYTMLALSWNSISGDNNYNAVCNLDDSGESLNSIDTADLAVFCGNWLTEN